MSLLETKIGDSDSFYVNPNGRNHVFTFENFYTCHYGAFRGPYTTFFSLFADKTPFDPNWLSNGRVLENGI